MHASEVVEGRLYVCQIPREGVGSDKQHVLAFLRSVNEDAMFEYVDPVTGGVVGCCGCNRLGEFVTPLATFAPRPSAWKLDHANEAERVLEHELVKDVMEEFAGNMKFSLSGLPAYGLAKVVCYAAQVARAQALGIDPDELRN